MKSQDAIIRGLRESMQIEPSACLENRIISSATTSATSPYKMKRISMRAALIAASIAVFTLVTGFAYGAEIIATISEIMFGDSRAAQVESIDGGKAGLAFEIINRIEEANANYPSSVSFSSVEEANEKAPFTIKAPSYLPDDVKLESVSVNAFKDKSLGYDVYMDYKVETPTGEDGFLLAQYYGGPDASVNILALDNIQKVMLGEIEAIVVDDGAAVYWMNDEVLYELHNTFFYPYDLDTLLRIAESMR